MDGDDDEGDRQGQAFVRLSEFYETVLPRLANHRNNNAAADHHPLQQRITFHRSFGNAQALELGRALLRNMENNNVTELDLDLESLRCMDGADADETDDDLSPLLQFLRTSSSHHLHTIRYLFLSEQSDSAVALRFWKATAARQLLPTNSQTTTTVELHQLGRAHLPALQLFMNECARNENCAVRALVLRNFQIIVPNNHHGTNFEAARQLATAVLSHTTLESLAIVPDNSDTTNTGHRLEDASCAGWVPTLLEALQKHPSLQHLRLQQPAGSVTTRAAANPDQLAWVLRPLSRLAPRLQHLELVNLCFVSPRQNQDNNAFRAISDGIRHRSTMLSKLSILNCFFDPVASRLLEEALVNGSSGGGSMIRSLHLSRHTRFAARDNPKHDNGAGLWLAHVFDAYRSPRQPQLQEIVVHDAMEASIPPDNSMRFVFDALWNNARCATLRALTMHIVSPAELTSLIGCLPFLVHLRELHLYNTTGRIDFAQSYRERLVSALRKNGSLKRLTVHRRRIDQDDDNFLDNEDSITVQNVCRRNQAIPTMITRPRLEHNHDSDNSDCPRTPLHLYPKLLHQSFQCSATGLTWALAGLVATGDLFGPKEQGTTERGTNETGTVF